MSPRRLLVAFSRALLVVAVAHAAQLSEVAASAADALTEVATGAMKAFEGVQDTAPQSDVSAGGHTLSTSIEKPGPSFFHSAAQDAAHSGQLALTTDDQLEAALRQLRTNVAQNSDLMETLARGAREADESGVSGDEDNEDDEADAVVLALARAVHSWVLERAAVADSPNERPAALAALHRWDALGPFTGTGGLSVAASQVSGVALLMGRPNEHAVDGAAAVAFRALERTSDKMRISASIQKREESRCEHRERLQQAAAAAAYALEEPTTSCLHLLGGKVGHAAVHAAASAMELTVCRFVVTAYSALHAVSEDRDHEVFDTEEASYITALRNAKSILVGPVLGGGAAPRGSRAGRANVGSPVTAVLEFLTSIRMRSITAVIRTSSSAVSSADTADDESELNERDRDEGETERRLSVVDAADDTADDESELRTVFEAKLVALEEATKEQGERKKNADLQLKAAHYANSEAIFNGRAKNLAVAKEKKRPFFFRRNARIKFNDEEKSLAKSTELQRVSEVCAAETLLKAKKNVAKVAAEGKVELKCLADELLFFTRSKKFADHFPMLSTIEYTFGGRLDSLINRGDFLSIFPILEALKKLSVVCC